MQQWTIEEISIFSNSSHLEWRVQLSDTILKWDYPRTIPARFGLIWFSGFRGEDLNVILSILCHPPFKMAAVTKNRNFFSCQFPLYYKSKLTQILTAAIWQ
jgi:hypothetical protein